jgi:hypothetical protein
LTSFAVASADERQSVDDALFALFPPRHGFKVTGQPEGAKLSFKRAVLIFEYDQINLSERAFFLRLLPSRDM